VAFPLASSFVVWLFGALASVAAYRRAKYYFVRTRYLLGAVFIGVSIGVAFVAIGGGDEKSASADNPIPNNPIGIAKGIHPGKVGWAHNPDATDWDGPDMGDGHWWESDNTDMVVVDQMMSQAIRDLAGENSSSEAWVRIFRHFNQARGKGDIGYQAGEKITIKVNLVGFIGVWGGGSVDPDTYDLVRRMDYMNTSPQMMLALLRQLVYVVGVNQADISIGDTLCYFPNQYYDMLHSEFPDVRYLDYEGKFGRTPVQQSSVPLYWSSHPIVSNQDYVPVSYAQADYIINMANFKSHTSAGVTLCAKNHYGSLVRWPGQSGYYELHNDLPSGRGGMGHYRTLVDLMGHAHIGRKTLLYLIDGLYAGHHPYDDYPTKMNLVPFNGDWSSSLFVSQDPVAIDSVAFDFLWAEPGWDVDTHISGGDDYLHEAAQADNPPSGTFYDPDRAGDVSRLESLGVHEHWNNPTDKQYSRNLGTGEGIELILADEFSPEPVIDDLTFDQCISELCTSTISVSAHDPAGGNLTYEWEALNGGLIIGAGESVDFEPPDTDPHACPYQVELTITSDASGLSLSQTIDIYVKLAGNVNGDANVNIVDKVLVRNSFGQSGDPGWIDEDVNCDGYVNVVDKVLVRNQFGDTCCGCP
jgi:hypothetical protein